MSVIDRVIGVFASLDDAPGSPIDMLPEPARMEIALQMPLKELSKACGMSRAMVATCKSAAFWLERAKAHLSARGVAVMQREAKESAEAVRKAYLHGIVLAKIPSRIRQVSGDGNCVLYEIANNQIGVTRLDKTYQFGGSTNIAEEYMSHSGTWLCVPLEVEGQIVYSGYKFEGDAYVQHWTFLLAPATAYQVLAISDKGEIFGRYDADHTVTEPPCIIRQLKSRPTFAHNIMSVFHGFHLLRITSAMLSSSGHYLFIRGHHIGEQPISWTIALGNNGAVSGIKLLDVPAISWRHLLMRSFSDTNESHIDETFQVNEHIIDVITTDAKTGKTLSRKTFPLHFRYRREALHFSPGTGRLVIAKGIPPTLEELYIEIK